MKFEIILDPNVTPYEVKELGLLAESYGFSAIWTSNYPSSRDPFLNLTPLIFASKKIRIGALVVTPWELHPYRISKAVHSLNELSEGRTNIFIGGPTGVNATMGMGTDKMVGRVKECVEILQAVKADEPLRYKGNYYSVSGYQPQWISGEKPQIYIGANQEQMLSMATRLADNLMMGDPTPERMKRSVEQIDGLLEKHQRSRDHLRLSTLIAWHVKDDLQYSMKEARSQLALRGMLDEFYLRDFLSDEEYDIVEDNLDVIFMAYKDKTGDIEEVPPAIIEKMIDQLSMSGDHSSIDKHIQTLETYKSLGIDDISFKLHDDQEQAIRTIGEKIIPHFR